VNSPQRVVLVENGSAVECVLSLELGTALAATGFVESTLVPGTARWSPGPGRRSAPSRSGRRLTAAVIDAKDKAEKPGPHAAPGPRLHHIGITGLVVAHSKDGSALLETVDRAPGRP